MIDNKLTTETVTLNPLTSAILKEVTERAKQDADAATSKIIDNFQHALLCAAAPLVGHAADNDIINAVTDFGVRIRTELSVSIATREMKRITQQLTGKSLL